MMSWLIDTNIQLRFVDRQHPSCRLTRRAILRLKRTSDRAFIASQNIVEFWAVATRPIDANGLGLSVERALSQVTRMQRFYELLPDTPKVQEEWERLVVQHRVLGKKVYDARLVAAMKVNGIANILTFNVADFARYPGIQAVSPDQIVSGVYSLP